MLTLKPFVRVTILSLILALLLIYLGINYHWGKYLKGDEGSTVTLSIPEKAEVDPDISNSSKVVTYSPELLQSNSANALLDSMNKEQMTEHCVNLSSKQIKDPLLLEIATVNCVVSNYQETFQNIKKAYAGSKHSPQKERQLRSKCRLQYITNNEYTVIEKELLIGICVSDNLSTQQ